MTLLETIQKHLENHDISFYYKEVGLSYIQIPSMNPIMIVFNDHIVVNTPEHGTQQIDLASYEETAAIMPGAAEEDDSPSTRCIKIIHVILDQYYEKFRNNIKKELDKRDIPHAQENDYIFIPKVEDYWMRLKPYLGDTIGFTYAHVMEGGRIVKGKEHRNFFQSLSMDFQSSAIKVTMKQIQEIYKDNVRAYNSTVALRQIYDELDPIITARETKLQEMDPHIHIRWSLRQELGISCHVTICSEEGHITHWTSSCDTEMKYWTMHGEIPMQHLSDIVSAFNDILNHVKSHLTQEGKQ